MTEEYNVAVSIHCPEVGKSYMYHKNAVAFFESVPRGSVAMLLIECKGCGEEHFIQLWGGSADGDT